MGISDFHHVGWFHERFGLDNVTHRGVGPRKVSKELMQFRLMFLAEELQEIAEAMGIELSVELKGSIGSKIDEVKLADGLIDLNYVSHGTAHLFGFPWHELFLEVQRANMKKVRAEKADQSTRGSTYDVVKPEGWKPPNILKVLKMHGWPL